MPGTGTGTVCTGQKFLLLFMYINMFYHVVCVPAVCRIDTFLVRPYISLLICTCPPLAPVQNPGTRYVKSEGAGEDHTCLLHFNLPVAWVRTAIIALCNN